MYKFVPFLPTGALFRELTDELSVRRAEKAKKEGGKVLNLFFWKDIVLGGKSIPFHVFFLCLTIVLVSFFMVTFPRVWIYFFTYKWHG